MIGFSVFLFIVISWLVGYKIEMMMEKKKQKQIAKDDLVHRYDPPIDPMFGKR